MAKFRKIKQKTTNRNNLVTLYKENRELFAGLGYGRSSSQPVDITFLAALRSSVVKPSLPVINLTIKSKSEE